MEKVDKVKEPKKAKIVYVGPRNRKDYGFKRSQLTSVELTEGEPIEWKVKRMLRNGEPISDGAPDIFTERKDGIGAGYDVRTDRFELAAEAMDKVAKSKLAARENKGKVVKLETDNEGGEAKGTDGETNVKD